MQQQHTLQQKAVIHQQKINNIKMKKTSQNVRINLSFTQDEFDCITKYANELDLSLSGFIYANMKVCATASSILGHPEIYEAYLKMMIHVYDILEDSKKNNDDTYFEGLQALIEMTTEINGTMIMARKLNDFSKEWSELRLLK
jgi:hypothetical protein